MAVLSAGITAVAGGLAGGTALGQGIVWFDPGPGGVVIPDGTGVGYADVRTVASPFPAALDVKVHLQVQGSGGAMWNGDIFATLSYQATPTAPVTAYSVLLNRPGRDDAHLDHELGYEDNGFNISIGATGPDVHLYRTTTTPPVGAPLTGHWSADGRDVDPFDVVHATPRTAGMEGFHGINPNGVWTLYMEDSASGGRARLVRWGLEWTPVPEPGPTAAWAGAALGGWAWLRLRRRRS